MSGLEAGRINIAARCVGVAQAALEDAAGWAATHGEAPPELADIATGVAASRLITYWAGGMKDRSERCDLEAGMAKLLASEIAQTVAVAAIRVLGEAGTLAEHTVERHYRDTPLMIIGEGTNEIQRTLIARQLVDRYGERPGALTSREQEPDERRQLVLMVRQFVDKSLAPVAGDLERAGRRPDALVAELAGLGLLGALVGPDLGGLGLDLATTVMILEELARGWTTVASIVAGHLVASYAIDRFAPHDAREALLPAMTRGERMGASVFGGAVRAHTDAGDIVLSGSTALVDNGAHADLIVLAATDPRGGRLTCVVETATAGVARRAVGATLGQRGLDACSIAFDDARLSTAAVLDDDGRSRAVACLAVAATATGLAQAAFEAALRYAQQRTTFGKPLAQHQAVQLKLADMASRITASRLLTSHAAESGEAHGPELAGGDDGAALGVHHSLRDDARGHAHPRRLRLRERVPDRAILSRRRPLDARARRRRHAAPRAGGGHRGPRERLTMPFGRYFEEFSEGQVIRHWPGRTITEADCTWFALLTMNQHPLHSDAHYAETHTQHGQRVVLGPLVFSIGIGMTVADISGKAIANLEIERITHEAPTFIGDTIYSESTVLAARESSQGDRGIVSVETRVTNQRGERVMTFRRTALVPKRNHPSLGEGKLPA